MTKNTRITDIIAKNLYYQRKLRGLSQKDVADILGVSFQQVQKYEKGRNRIPAHHLYILKQTWHIDFDTFFLGTVECDSEKEKIVDRIAQYIRATEDRDLCRKLATISEVLLAG